MDRQEAIALLQQRRINPTKQRVDIAMQLFDRPQHLSADQVIDAMRQRGGVSKATVYNTLNLFSHCGLLRELHVDGNKVYYDTNTTPHHHIYNVDSGELCDVMADIDLSAISIPAGTTPVGVELIFRVKGQEVGR